MSTYTLTVIAADHRTTEFKSVVWGETPRVGDLVTVHPDDAPSDRSVTAHVTGVQRVIRQHVDPPGAPRTVGLRTTHVAVTAKVEP